MDIIRAGRTLFLRERRDSKPHLWLVLTDPTGKPPEVVAVMVCTLAVFTDKTLILNVGDHPFIRRASSVHYSTAQFFRVKAIQDAIGRKQCSLREDMSAGLLERARQGLLDSPSTINLIREHCQAHHPNTAPPRAS